MSGIEVTFIDKMGSDARVRNVAWTSFDAEVLCQLTG